jgi:hypothetical protein
MQMAMRVRSLIWLIAVMAFVLPSIAGPAAAALASRAAMSDCSHEAPPPNCPDNDTAKHAAGLCCPAMSGTIAVVPHGVAISPDELFTSAASTAAARLNGLNPEKDPPPPRV